MEIAFGTAAADGILTKALLAVIHEGRNNGSFGFLVEARPEFPLREFLDVLADEDAVFVSLIAMPDTYPPVHEIRKDGWTEHTLGADATHAVRVRNYAPSDALKVAVVWSEEARLHSLTRRGYQPIGADDLVTKIAIMGERGRAQSTAAQPVGGLGRPASADNGEPG